MVQFRAQYLNGSIKSLINQISNYKVPESNKNYPIDISISYDGEEMRNLQSSHTPESSIVTVLFFYFLKSVKHQLADRPEQFLSTELAASILNIQHESMLEILNDGEILYSKFNNSICVRSENLFKYRDVMKKERSELLTQLAQCDY